MEHVKQHTKELQYWLAKEFIEERLCLSVSTKAIADFAAFIDIFEQQSNQINSSNYGGENDSHSN